MNYSNNLKRAALTSSVILFLFLTSYSAFSQANQPSKSKQPANSPAITAEQTSQVKKILSGYNASKLNAQDAKAIQEKFRGRGWKSVAPAQAA